MWLSAPDAIATARLVSTPVYRNWASSLVSVSDCNIVPCATYTIDAITNMCAVNPSSFSPPLALKTTSRWGDISGTNGSFLSPPDGGPVGFIDIGWVVDRFKGASTIGPGERPRCDLCKNVPTQGGGSANIDFFDVGCAVDAFQGKMYDQSVHNGSGQHGPAGAGGTCATP
jgi:hypothetical protein